MKKAAIIIDEWKLPIFEKHLEEARYLYEISPGITPSTLILTVKYEWVSKLQPVVMAANEECKNEKLSKPT